MQAAVQAVDRLHELTEWVAQHDLAAVLHHTTLVGELDAIVQLGGEWLMVDLVVRAVDYLLGVLGRIQTPLDFSNGDYNPLDFLHDGEALTGYVDFEHACFEDPHAGFAKFVTLSFDEYGWGTGMKAGLVEHYLYAHNISRHEFLPRLILRCVRRLQREVSTNGKEDSVQREYMLKLLQEGLSEAEQS